MKHLPRFRINRQRQNEVSVDDHNIMLAEHAESIARGMQSYGVSSQSWNKCAPLTPQFLREVAAALANTVTGDDAALRKAIKRALAHRYGDWTTILENALAAVGEPERPCACGKDIGQMRADLAMYDYLLPGDYVPEPPLVKRWFRWRPAFQITQEMLVWAGDIARARSLMDLKSAEEAICTAQSGDRT